MTTTARKDAAIEDPRVSTWRGVRCGARRRRAIRSARVAVWVLLVASTAGATERKRPWVLDLEAGASWQGRNQVQSPNAAPATRFALDGITGDGPVAAGRLQLAWPFRERQEWRLLAAPLTLSATGALREPVVFEGASFTAGAGPVRARYRFDSWRVTWRYLWIDRPDLKVKVGVTANVRDASIELRQVASHARKDNTGFVPLLHAALERPLGERWSLQADVDALAGGPGYAIDGGLRLARTLGDDWSVSAGVRYLDGGADNDEVYAFATFTSVTFGVARQFR